MQTQPGSGSAAAASPPSIQAGWSPPWQHHPVPGAAQRSTRDGSVPQISAAGSLAGGAPRERGRFGQTSGLVMLSADSLGAGAEVKAQIPLPFFNQKKRRKIIQEFSLCFPC